MKTKFECEIPSHKANAIEIEIIGDRSEKPYASMYA
jgi:hypothetical protein